MVPALHAALNDLPIYGCMHACSMQPYMGRSAGMRDNSSQLRPPALVSPSSLIFMAIISRFLLPLSSRMQEDSGRSSPGCHAAATATPCGQHHCNACPLWWQEMFFKDAVTRPRCPCIHHIAAVSILYFVCLAFFCFSTAPHNIL